MVLVLAVVGFAGAKVFAESSNSGSGSLSSGNASPMIVNIGPKGNALMRGIVDGAPSVDTIKVKSWGGVWEVKISSSTQLISAGKVIADFQDGDFVGVIGTISTDGSFIIDAKIVREWRGKAENDNFDSDHDGILNNDDLDDDNDGILDVNELSKAKDHDNDGIPDLTDTDDDGDGILDVNDHNNDDFDNDGISDSRDHDDDNDGVDDSHDSRSHGSDSHGQNDDDDDDNSGSGN